MKNYFEKFNIFPRRLVFHRKGHEAGHSLGLDTTYKTEVAKKGQLEAKLKQQSFHERYKLLAEKKIKMKIDREVTRRIEITLYDPDPDKPEDAAIKSNRRHTFMQRTTITPAPWKKQGEALYEYLEERMGELKELKFEYRLAGLGEVKGRHDLKILLKKNKRGGITVYWRTQSEKGHFSLTSDGLKKGKIPRYFVVYEKVVTNDFQISKENQAKEVDTRDGISGMSGMEITDPTFKQEKTQMIMGLDLVGKKIL